MVANSALDVVTVNGRMHRDENSGPKQNSGCAWSKTICLILLNTIKTFSLIQF